MSRDRKRILGASWIAALLLLLAAPAHAGEADHEPDDTHEHGAAYFGEAKDIRGLTPVEAVLVKGQVRGTTRFFIIPTDPEGRFKRAGLGLDVDAEKVEFTCEKAGYRLVDVMRRRMSGAKDAAVEVECLLERQ